MSREIQDSPERVLPHLFAVGAFQKDIHGLYVPVDPSVDKSQRTLFYMPEEWHPADPVIPMQEKVGVEFALVGSLQILIPATGSPRVAIVDALHANPHIFGQTSDGAECAYVFNLTEKLQKVEGGFNVTVVFFKHDPAQARLEEPLLQRRPVVSHPQIHIPIS